MAWEIEGRKGGCRARFTEFKTDLSRITHHSTCALIFHPYSTTGLTCWPFCMIIACTLNNCFSRSNTKFTLIHKCMPLPTHQDGVENRDKAYCRFASPICDYLLFNKKKYKVNYYLGMKDMLRDMMQDHAISVIIVIWRTLQNHSSVTWIFLHPTYWA